MLIDRDFIFPVYIYENVLKVVKEICGKSNLELFGYLVGNVLEWKNKKYIIVTDQLYNENAVDSQQYFTSQIDGTAGNFDVVLKGLRELRKDNDLRILGWWHTHPDFGCFLSTTDIHTQKFFFPESYQVALIVDPIRKEYTFYTLDKSSKKGYKEISHAIISIN
ncbi:MAG: Mov34/MPN/PAD-1 family protein [Candidatus Lokiarchaeota archaeon]|nr:Mov34/MPN/PAD-1 family protein [Candidatus Lokiarchaeota archaeon]